MLLSRSFTSAFVYQISSKSDDYRPTHMHSADYAVARYLSVRLSVTRRYSVGTAEHILNRYCSPAPSSINISDGNPPNGCIECKGVYLPNDAS